MQDLPERVQEKPKTSVMRLAFITTCMDRLDHVKQSVPALLQREIRIDGVRNFFVFVDYMCPDKSGDWVTSSFPQLSSVVQVPVPPLPDGAAPVFHKSGAMNRGAVRAIGLGADFLVFLDADTIVTPEFLDFVFEHARPDRFLFCNPPIEKRDLCGLLCVPKDSFVLLGGYDERMIGWGTEDLDMRMRLHFFAGLEWTIIPHELSQAIPHSNELRERHSPFSLRESNDRNKQIMFSGLPPLSEEQQETAKLLLGVGETQWPIPNQIQST